jgi:essential nuclear protein 1
MPKVKSEKKSVQLRHAPLETVINSPADTLKQSKAMKQARKPKGKNDDDGDDDDLNAESFQVSNDLGSKVLKEARSQRLEQYGGKSSSFSVSAGQNESDEDFDGNFNDEDALDEELALIDGEFVCSSGLTEAEENIVNSFLNARADQTRSFADIIMEKIKEKSYSSSSIIDETSRISPKVAEVYSSVGSMLHHYKSGKLPKALKMLPHVKNWEVMF